MAPKISERIWDGVVVWSILLSFFTIASITSNVGALTVEFVRSFGVTRFQAALAGSLCCGVSFGSSMVAVTLMEKFGNYAPMVASSALTTGLPLIAASVQSHAGICVVFVFLGMSMSVLVSGYTSILALRFQNRHSRAVAYGIVEMGAGTGAISMSLVIGWTAQHYGYLGVLYLFSCLGGLTMLSMAFYSLVPPPSHSVQTILTEEAGRDKSALVPDNRHTEVSHSLTQQNPSDEAISSKSTPSLRDVLWEYVQLFRDVRLPLFFLAYALTHMAFYEILVLGEDLLVDMFAEPKSRTQYFLVAFNVGTFFGRPVGSLLNYFNTNRLLILAISLAALGVIEAVYPLTNFVIICSATGVAGIIFGIMISCMFQVIIDIFGLEKISRYIGVMFTSNGLGAAMGGPIGGAIKDYFSYHETFYFGGTAMITGALLFAIIAAHPATRTMRLKENLSSTGTDVNNEKTSLCKEKS